MAALVASLSRPVDEGTKTESTAEPGPATAGPGPAPVDSPPRPVSLDAGSRVRRRLEQGRAATVEIAVDEPGSVAVPDLGLTASADEHTPARFEVFPTRTGAYAILFTPVDDDRARPAGTLVVTAAG
jgi:hypothetical protein